MAAAYYRPYMSDDSESDSDTDSDTSSGYTSEESLMNVPGKNPPVETGMPAALKADTTILSSKNAGTKFTSKESNNTTLFMINSRDRDTRIYPQPTMFTIRLPRTYRNIKTVNISQLNLLNSFFNFADTKANTWMYVYEQDRIQYDAKSGSTKQNAIKIQIRNGTYSSDDLVTELTNALNSTPLFADIALGKFIDYFQTSGDFTVLFNTPGSVVYNSLTQTYDRNKTINDIVARYFQIVQNVGTVSYTYNECLVAYYYPILKEMAIDPTAPAINYISDVPAGFSSWYDYIVFAFQGLGDPNITPILLNTENQALFDKYRLEHTFNNFLVNKYNCTYNAKQGRLVITAPSLNDSIQTDLNSQYNQYLNALVLSNGNFTSVNDFQTRYNTINNSNGALIEFYNFIQARFSSNFGVDFGRYTAEFYSDSNNEISIYNTLNKYGWNLSLTPQVSANTITSNAMPEQVPVYWSNILIPQANVPVDQFISTIKVPEFTSNMLSFSNAGESQYGYTDVYFPIQPTTYMRTTFKTRCRQDISVMALPRRMDQRGPSTDLIYNLGSTITQTPLLYDVDGENTIIRTDVTDNPLLNMYTVTQHMFHSADYMRAFDHWVDYITPQILAGTRIQPGNQNWNQRPPIVDIALTSYRTSIYFQVNADKYLVEPSAHFNVTFTVETQSGGNFPVPIKLVWYKDRAGFMADVATDAKNGVENPRHYFKKQTYGTDLSGAHMVIDVNNLQQTYFMVQFDSLDNIPSSIPLRIFCELTDAYGVYKIKQLTDTYDMPYKDLPALSDQYTPASDVFKNPTKSIYDSNIFKLGYDLSGVSNNLLDYIIQAGNGNFYDPNNITDYLNGTSTGLRYQMNLVSGGSKQPLPSISTNWSLYFGANSGNLVRDTYNTTSNVYLSGKVGQKPPDPQYDNEHTILNWFQAGDPFLRERFLQPHINDNYNTKISTTSIFLPCINSANPLLTDSYTVDSNYALDISGVSGIGFFLPPNYIVKLTSILVNFAYTQPSDFGLTTYTRKTSPLGLGGTEFTNAQYHNQTTEMFTDKSDMTDWDDWFIYNRRNTKLGVFNTADLYQKDINSISLSNAVCTMTLEKVTQVCNYQSQLGTLRTREPGWGTYYTYKFDPRSVSIWDVNTRVPESEWPTSSTLWQSTITTADYAPTYVAGELSYPNYFLTTEQIINYSYIPRSYGIATSVGVAYDYPDLVSTAKADIPNSYCAVPFYLDKQTNTWKVGSFYGISYTQEPAVPSTELIGQGAPYYGPPGIFGFTQSSSNTFELHNGHQSDKYERFYWNTKIQFETLDLDYNPATDLTKFGGFDGIKQEYQDTMLFMYKNLHKGDDYKDVSSVTTSVLTGDTYYWKWGQENNASYIAHDDQSGYNYLSYIHQIPVRPTVNEYAVHLRGYDPIPQFQTGLRFIGKNYTDFGKPTLWEIANEISALRNYSPISDSNAKQFIQEAVVNKSSSAYYTTIQANNMYRDGNSGNYFSHGYADALINFNMTFSTSVTFGKKIGYSGKQFDLYGYEDALKKYIDFFTSIRALYATYTTILSTATGQLNSYVNTRYTNVLPSTIINRNRITDPLPFQFLFKSKLEAPYDTQFDEWGLGWNLGFNKADTQPRTTITSDTFIRITQDYVYLRLNPELNMNTMGVSGKECRGCCQDSAGQDKKYFSKIILNNFGGFCRTAVQLPKEFNPVLGKYETISCQLVDKYGTQINNADCEYDFVLEMTEITNGPNQDSSLQGPESDLAIYAGEK